MEINNWFWGIIIYLALAIFSFIPVLLAIFKKVKLNPGGSTFPESSHFSEANKQKLIQHYSRLIGTLTFWKNKAEAHRTFHYYTLCWTIPVSILVPVLVQIITADFFSKLFLTIISTHIAVLYGFHRAFKIENNYKAFRIGESEFYDAFRRLLDRPKTFGEVEDQQIENYFIEVEKIRRNVRMSEIDNLPMLEENKSK